METLVCLKCGRSYADKPGQTICSQCGGTILQKNAVSKATNMLFNVDDVDVLPREVEEAMRNPANLFGKFILIRMIGKGGTAEVFRAWHSTLKQMVALKRMFSTDTEAIMRLNREAKSAARLKHPSIVQIHDLGTLETGGVKWHYICMDYIAGMPLNKFQAPLLMKLRILADIAEALEYAHKQGVIHRDIKPSNILVDRKGRGFLTDFGLARQVSDPRLTVTDVIVGTPYYMSPEQAVGHRELDFRTDVYSLGATMYEVLAGMPPFMGDSPYDVITKLLNEEPTRPCVVDPRMPRTLEAICLKALEKDRNKRYAGAGAFASDLKRYLDGEPAPFQMLYYKLARGARRKAVLAISVLAILGILTAAGFAVSKALQGSPSKTSPPPVNPSPPEAPPNPLPGVERTIRSFDLAEYAPEHPIKDDRASLVQALSEVQDLLHAREDSPAVHYLAGRIHLRLGELESARAHLSRAIELREDGEYFFERAIVSLRLFERARSDDPERAKQNMKALKEQALADLKASRGYARKADQAYFEAVFLNGEGESAKALKLCDGALAASDVALKADVLYLRATVLLDSGRLAAGVRDLEAFLAIRRSSLEGCARLASACRQIVEGRSKDLDVLDRGCDAARRATVIDGADYRGHFHGGALHALKAEVLYAAKKDPTDDCSKAIESLRIAADLRPVEYEPHIYRARAYYVLARSRADSNLDNSTEIGAGEDCLRRAWVNYKSHDNPKIQELRAAFSKLKQR